MKKLVQNEGVRKWYGDEWITIQDDLNDVIEGFFGHFDRPFILTGCEVDGFNISSGIVGLLFEDGFKLVRVTGGSVQNFPVYVRGYKFMEDRPYLDGATKPVAYVYLGALGSAPNEASLEIKQDGTTARFVDIIQDMQHQFCTEDEKSAFASQASAALSVIREGIATDYNTLEKLRVHLTSLIPSEANLDAVYSYIDGLTYLPVYRGSAELTTTTINWLTSTPERFMTLTAATELDASNLIAGKTIGLKVNGAYALSFSAKFHKMVGSPSPLTTAVNYIQMKCLNDALGQEYIVYTVMYLP